VTGFIVLLASLLSLQVFAKTGLPEGAEVQMAFSSGQTQKDAKAFLSLGDDWESNILDLKCFVRTSTPYLSDLFNNPISFTASVTLDRGDAIEHDQLWGKRKYPANMYLIFSSDENPELNTNPLALNLFPIKDRFSTNLEGYRLGSSTLQYLYRFDPRVVLSVLRPDGGVREYEGTPLPTRRRLSKGEEIHSSGTKVAVSVYDNAPFFFIETVGIYTDQGTTVLPYSEEKEGYSRSYVCRPISH
jgi:hypothetical protein